MKPDFDEVKKRWREEVYDKGDEVDPDDQFIWLGVAVGFLLGCGYTIKEARKLAHSLPV